jgi:pimeloyl-ACP methyl ester carboxylesterase
MEMAAHRSAEPQPAGQHLEWGTTTVDGRPAAYGVAGQGRRMVFLHGWGLAHHAYRHALGPLVRQRLRVYAPALPGFGGTASLPRDELGFAGYARWVAHFLDAVGIDGPVTLIGHSFGGGVAIQTAYDWPRRVSRLVLVNSIGGSAWSHHHGMVRRIRERPLWDWGLHLQADLLPIRQLTRVVPVIVSDAVPNLFRNPRAIWDVAHLARTADLTGELEELKRRRLPVVILWGRSDKVIPPASLESLCTALGDPKLITVPGKHSWLLADPQGFGEVMTDVVGVAPGAPRKRPSLGFEPVRLRTGRRPLARSGSRV